MRSIMSFAALAVAASVGGTALASEDTSGKGGDGDAPAIEMEVDEDAVPEDRRAEDGDDEDEAAVEMTVDQAKPKPRETWLTGDRPATRQED